MKIGITKEEARQLSALYKSQLSEIMEEWAEHSADPSGGYLTDFGETGNWFPDEGIYGLRHVRPTCSLPIMNIPDARKSGSHWQRQDEIFWFAMLMRGKGDGTMRCQRMGKR